MATELQAAKATRSRRIGRMQLPPGDIPPLESGDHLTRQEFERRYEAMPGVKKAELIEGIVHMPPAVKYGSHALPHSLIVTWLGAYYAETPRLHLADNGTLRLDMENEVQPDAMLLIDPSAGGQARIGEDDYVEGAPELIVEIASTSASYDLHEKRKVYRRAGVREYLVWQTRDRRLDWWELREGEMAKVLATLHTSLATPEHDAFLDRLRT